MKRRFSIKEEEKLIKKSRKLYSSGLTYTEILDKFGINNLGKGDLSKWCSDLAQARLQSKMKATACRKAKEKTEAARLREESRVGKPAKHPYEGWLIYKNDRGDGRVRYHLIFTNPRKDRYILRAKYNLEVKIGRKLRKGETVDHIDEDKTNDKKKNLQILSLTENVRKSHLHRNPHVYDPKECVICEKIFKHKNRRRETCSDKCKRKLMSLVHTS